MQVEIKVPLDIRSQSERDYKKKRLRKRVWSKMDKWTKNHIKRIGANLEVKHSFMFIFRKRAKIKYLN